ncbi:hypothetical protein [Pontimicrobium sp. SW4]|uniref:Uncharacterized protein n=1 Tax=Pontimicrobium sp. SW4 TaxID=3153519 RepID=A0AAU7BWL7_9FLAO
MSAYQIVYIVLSVTIWFIGFFHIGKYVKPIWKRYSKFVFYFGMSILLIFWVKHYSLIFIVGHQVLGLVFHIKACKKHDIDWKTCEPKDKYLELHEQWGKGKFK